MSDPDRNSFEGLQERLARARHEAEKIGTQRHVDSLRLMRGYADVVFQSVTEAKFQKARAYYNAFGRIWEDAPPGAKGATYHPNELRRVILVAERLVGAPKTPGV